MIQFIKSAIDAKINFDITDTEEKTLRSLNECLKKSTEFIKVLSKQKANLNTCDHAISKAISELSESDGLAFKKFKETLMKCYKSRRTCFAN